MAQSFTWEKAREELLYRRNRAMTHGGDRAVEKQRSRGGGLVRDRIGMLADPESFLEVGTMAIDHRFDSEGQGAGADAGELHHGSGGSRWPASSARGRGLHSECGPHHRAGP